MKGHEDQVVLAHDQVFGYQDPVMVSGSPKRTPSFILNSTLQPISDQRTGLPLDKQVYHSESPISDQRTRSVYVKLVINRSLLIQNVNIRIIYIQLL